MNTFGGGNKKLYCIVHFLKRDHRNKGGRKN